MSNNHSGASTTAITYTNDIIGLVQVLVADDGTEQVKNLFGLDLILQDDGATDLVLLVDGLGSVRAEMVGEGTKSVTTYNPYGLLLAQEGNRGSVYGFTGEQEDEATGLLYLRARYYSSELLTFIKRDPWPGRTKQPGTLHGYMYVLGNPVRYVDPRGLCDPYCPPTPPGTPSPLGTPSPPDTPTQETPEPLPRTYVALPAQTPAPIAIPVPWSRSGATIDYFLSRSCPRVDGKCEMYRNNGGFAGPLGFSDELVNQPLTASWDVQSREDCLVVQFDRRAYRTWSQDEFGERIYTRWTRYPDWVLDNASREEAEVGVIWISAHRNYVTISFHDSPGVGKGKYQGFEYWWNGKVSLYDKQLGNSAATYQTPSNPPPVPGSTIEWGVKLECEFGVDCKVAEAPNSPGLPPDCYSTLLLPIFVACMLATLSITFFLSKQKKVTKEPS